jgi:signal transduction histidine kinase
MSALPASPAVTDETVTAELQASRTRIVEAADEARRRLERDLHDGAQQRFVSASMLLGLARRQADGSDGPLVPVSVFGDLQQRPAATVRDDGRGGADPQAGSGLRGLVDRLGALGGHLHVESPRGGGTVIRAIVPLDPHDPEAEVSCGCCAEGQCRCGA